MITQEENLKSIIEEIKNNKIMLPDFQRQFDWNIEKQIGLVASVLTKLPVGGILLLEADSKDYKSKRIGLDSKEKIVGEIPQKTNFLLDGQQRMTCLTNVFSDVIHEASEKKVSRLAARQLLATRFYLKINRSLPPPLLPTCQTHSLCPEVSLQSLSPTVLSPYPVLPEYIPP